MAERRMLAKSIILSDAFLDMPATTRCLYFTLNMFGDDDGFVNNPKSIMRQTGASIDDLNLLIAKKFILSFESGVIVIKHWKIHNYIQKDRYKETKYIEEKFQITVDEKGAYTQCIQDVYIVDTQDRLDKDSIGKVSLGEERKDKKEIRHKYGEYSNVLLSDSDFEKLKNEFPTDWSNRIESLSSYMASTGKVYKNHLATIRNWAKSEASTKKEDNTGNNVFLALAKDEGIV